MPIKVLSPEVASKIAAGEVVERPASVVKELLENSLDAGSSQITVEIQNGGVSLIRVTDDGSGLPNAEAGVAFQRHATSKIISLDDLEHINTLGFRGEALPSIASVSEVEMLTSNGSASAGVYLRLENGEVVMQEKRSRPTGTTITVRYLFRNFPARLKFLKSTATESGHIANVVSQYALAFPQVKFSLLADGRVNLRTSGDGELRSTVSELYGLDTAQKMLHFESVSDWLKLSGLASPPSVQRASRSYLSFFVNRRYVRNGMLARAVETAYQGLLMTGRQPVVILNITILPSEVDVNVHPTKTEVKFRNNNVVFTAVEKALRDTLDKAPLPSMTGGADEDGQVLSLWERAASTADLPVLRTLGQLSASYILAEGPQGLYLIDQHAAHERILFDKLKAQHVANKPEIQGMLEPFSLELTPAQDLVYDRYVDLFKDCGFILEPFGERIYLVRAIPAIIGGVNLVETLNEILDVLGSEKETLKREEKMMQTLACHGAIRAGDVLGLEEMRHLVVQLERTNQPRTCPHGRPTMIHLSSQQLRKEFGRAG